MALDFTDSLSMKTTTHQWTSSIASGEWPQKSSLVILLQGWQFPCHVPEPAGKDLRVLLTKEADDVTNCFRLQTMRPHKCGPRASLKAVTMFSEKASRLEATRLLKFLRLPWHAQRASFCARGALVSDDRLLKQANWQSMTKPKTKKQNQNLQGPSFRIEADTSETSAEFSVSQSGPLRRESTDLQ